MIAQSSFHADPNGNVGFNLLAFHLEQTLQEVCVLMHKPRTLLFLGLPYQKGDSVSLWEIPLQVFLTTLPSLSSHCRLAVGDPLCPGIPVLLLPRGHCLGSDILHELTLLGPSQPCCWPPRQMVLLPDLTPQDNRQRTICSSFVEVTSLQNWKLELIGN